MTPWLSIVLTAVFVLGAVGVYACGWCMGAIWGLMKSSRRVMNELEARVELVEECTRLRARLRVAEGSWSRYRNEPEDT